MSDWNPVQKNIIDANREYHQKGVLDLITSRLHRRFGAAGFFRDLEEDFRRAAEIVLTASLSSRSAVDALTGDGQHIERFLQAGFSPVIGVDISSSELEKAYRRFSHDPRVILVEEEISSFLSKHPHEFAFIHLGSLHHIPDPLALLAVASYALNPGGCLYLHERRRLNFWGRLLVRLDDHLFTFLSSPSLWWSRIFRKLGLAKDSLAHAWDLASNAEAHAISGIDHEEIRVRLQSFGLREIFFAFAYHPATRFFYYLCSPWGFQDGFRLLAQRVENLTTSLKDKIMVTPSPSPSFLSSHRDSLEISSPLKPYSCASPFLLVHLVHRLTLGGETRVMRNLALLSSERFLPLVVGIEGDPEYVVSLQKEGIIAGILGHEVLSSPELLRGKIESLVCSDTAYSEKKRSLYDSLKTQNIGFLIVIHRSGEATPLWNRLLPLLRDAGARNIVEYNHFGYVDTVYREIDLTFFVSLDTMRHHWRMSGSPPLEDYLVTHSILYNPVLLSLAKEKVHVLRKEARARWGIPPEAFVIGWVGRPDPRRIDAMLPLIISRLRRTIPSLYLLTRQYPPFLFSQCKPGCNLPLTADADELRLTYAAMDVFAHFSSMGESFGMAIAEAMRCGIPVVTHHTPGFRQRNGQAELVVEGETGFFADDPLTAVHRIEQLARSQELREQMGEAARHRFTVPPFAPHTIRDLFESELGSLLRKTGIEWDLPLRERFYSESFIRAYFLGQSKAGSRRKKARNWKDRIWETKVQLLRLLWRIQRRWF